MSEDSTSKLPQSNTSTSPSTTQRPKRLASDLLQTRTLAVYKKKLLAHPTLLALSMFLLLILIGFGPMTIGYYYYTDIHAPLLAFHRSVQRGGDEPLLNSFQADDAIQGHPWNILLLGSDNDGKYTYPYVLTQVMMVVHVDPTNNSVYLVSIPRDSWVKVPGVDGMHKIDQAFFLGANQSHNFEGGVQTARATIENDYGIPIDRYAWVGLDGFAKVIDTLGGVDIDVTHPVIDDMYPDDSGHSANPHNPYAFKRLYIAPGAQHLTGEQALEYVRSRHADLVGDIGRTQRQQQILEALKLKLTVTAILSNLPSLMKDLTGNVYTDLNEDEILAFANFGRTLPASAIRRVTFGPGRGKQNFGTYQSVYDPSINANQDVIIPNCEAIQPVLNDIFGLGEMPSCNV